MGDSLLLFGIGAVLVFFLYREFKHKPKDAIEDLTKALDRVIEKVTPSAPPKKLPPYYDFFKLAAEKWKVPIRLMVATVDYESDFKTDAVNEEAEADEKWDFDVDSLGLGQILWPKTAQALAKKEKIIVKREDLFNPIINLNFVGSLYNELLKRYPTIESSGFPAMAVAAYNAGSAKYKANGDFINQTYVDRVRSRWVSWKGLQ